MEEEERKRQNRGDKPTAVMGRPGSPRPQAGRDYKVREGTGPSLSERKKKEAATMLGAAELATSPFGIGLKGLATGFKAGVKGVRQGLVRNPGGILKTQKIDLGADYTADLVKKAALNKQREKELRAVRSGFSPGPHPDPPTIMPKNPTPVKSTVRDLRPSKNTRDFFGDPPGATQRMETLPARGANVPTTPRLPRSGTRAGNVIPDPNRPGKIMIAPMTVNRYLRSRIGSSRK